MSIQSDINQLLFLGAAGLKTNEGLQQKAKLRTEKKQLASEMENLERGQSAAYETYKIGGNTDIETKMTSAQAIYNTGAGIEQNARRQLQLGSITPQQYSGIVGQRQAEENLYANISQKYDAYREQQKAMQERFKWNKTKEYTSSLSREAYADRLEEELKKRGYEG